MLKSEKKSLVRFLLIYLGSTFLLFSIAAWIFYTSQKHYLLDQQRDSLKAQSAKIVIQLHTLHASYTDILVYPVLPLLDSAIYDLDKKYIFGTGNKISLLEKKDYMKNEKVLYDLSEVQPHYLGAAFLVVSKALDEVPIKALQKDIVLFLLAAGLFFSFLGLYLGRLFIAPMRESMEKMNLFIEDTTHELNTPISTILINIEMMETYGNCADNEELQNIEIASKTLSRIYDDLTYLNLNHQYFRRIEMINVSEFILERMRYFNVMAESKNLTIEENIDKNVVLEIDKNDLTRLVDNLISNAIKYNKKDGLLKLQLTDKLFSVTDTGIGILKKDLDTIVCRFKRSNKSEGGFGIGLDIVKQVVDSYDFSLNIDSVEGQGTEVSIKWEK